jgi:hypothetical protein
MVPVVVEVAAGSSAEGKLSVGDQLLSVDGALTDTVAAVVEALSATKDLQRVRVTVSRSEPGPGPADSLRVKFPLLAAGAADAADAQGVPAASALLVLGGGGGSSRTGVPNGLTLCSVVDGQLTEHGQWRTGDDAILSLGVDDAARTVVCVQGASVLIYEVAPPPLTVLVPKQQLELSQVRGTSTLPAWPSRHAALRTPA